MIVSADHWGRIAREARVRWARKQPDPKPAWLVPYDELSEADKDADRMIGCAVAARASRATHAELEPIIADLLAACRAFHEAMDQIDGERRDRQLIAAEALVKAAIVRAGGRIIGPD
jgi:hypothetical protein